MLKITIKTDNAAFEPKGYELARILREIADNLEIGVYQEAVLDYNGNIVGKVELD